MEKHYWKVSRYNIKYLPGINDDQINVWVHECDRIVENAGYIYICTDEYSNYGFMPYKQYSIDFFKEYNYEYKGEFNSRKNKLEKLQQLYGKILLESK